MSGVWVVSGWPVVGSPTWVSEELSLRGHVSLNHGRMALHQHLLAPWWSMSIREACKRHPLVHFAVTHGFVLCPPSIVSPVFPVFSTSRCSLASSLPSSSFGSWLSASSTMRGSDAVHPSSPLPLSPSPPPPCPSTNCPPPLAPTPTGTRAPGSAGLWAAFLSGAAQRAMDWAWACRQTEWHAVNCRC